MKGNTPFSHKTDDWKTPTDLYKYFMSYCEDPCPFMSKTDNLNKLYVEKSLYINPPYSQIAEWTEFIYKNYLLNEIILLIPSRTDTKYFHKLLELNPIIIFIKGRLRFNDIGSAPFPSMVLYFSKIKQYQNYYFVENQSQLATLLNILRSDLNDFSKN